MGRALEQMALSVSATWRALRDWFAEQGANPLGWSVGVWLALGAALLLLLWLALRPRRPRRPRAVGRPELLVSQGEIAPLPESSLWRLTMAVSNLNGYPVQLLELALTEKGGGPVRIADLDLLVPPNGSSRVELELDPLLADEGGIELFAYTAATRRRVWRLRAGFVWEPWNDRYKIDPLRQRVDAARTLASARERRERQEAWRRERLAPADEPEPLVAYPIAEGFEDLVEPLPQAAPERDEGRAAVPGRPAGRPDAAPPAARREPVRPGPARLEPLRPEPDAPARPATGPDELEPDEEQEAARERARRDRLEFPQDF